MSLGPPRGAITGPGPDDDAFWTPEPPPRPAPRRRRVQNYRKTDVFPPKVRLAILARDGMVCQLCGVGLTLQPNRPDSAIAGHVLARWRGGAPVLANGRAECRDCSVRGGGQERMLSGPPRRPPRPRPDQQQPTVW